MMVSNRNLLFQGSIFRFHVCFGGCISFFFPIAKVQFFLTSDPFSPSDAAPAVLGPMAFSGAVERFRMWIGLMG